MNQIRKPSILAAIGAWACALVLIALAIPLIGAVMPGVHTTLVASGRVLDAPRVFTGAPLIVGMIINSANLKDATRSFNTLFNGAFDSAPSKWNKVAMEVISTTKETTYAWLGLSTRFREWLGDRVVQNLKNHGYSIINKLWEDTIGVQATDIKDDQIGVYGPLFQQLGFDAKTHPDELVFGLIKTADAVKCYDGQNFFDADHPVLDENGVEQSVSNYQAGAHAPWILLDGSKPIKPFILQTREKVSFQAKDNPDDENVFMRNEFLYGASARHNVGVGLWQLAFMSRDVLSVANYAAARVALLSMESDGGKKLNVMPNILLVGPTNEGAANALLKAQKDAAGADNIWFGTAEVVVAPWLE